MVSESASSRDLIGSSINPSFSADPGDAGADAGSMVFDPVL
jgi:hypothetical protein